MHAAKFFTIDLARVKGKGDFKCPKCGIKISPEDSTERSYTILETFVKENELESIMLQCKKCESQIHLTGFRALC